MPAPTTKRFLKSGVPLEPLHRYQPDGIEFTDPDHKPIKPEGREASEPEGPGGPVGPVEPPDPAGP